MSAGKPGRIKQIDELCTHQDVLFERHRAVFGDNHFGMASHSRKQITEILGVGYCGAQRYLPD